MGRYSNCCPWIRDNPRGMLSGFGGGGAEREREGALLHFSKFPRTQFVRHHSIEKLRCHPNVQNLKEIYSLHLETFIVRISRWERKQLDPWSFTNAGKQDPRFASEKQLRAQTIHWTKQRANSARQTLGPPLVEVMKGLDLLTESMFQVPVPNASLD